MRLLEQADALFRVEYSSLFDVLQEEGLKDSLFTFGVELLTSVREKKGTF